MYLIEFFKKSKSTLIFLLFFTIVFVPILYFLVKPKSQLPVYNPVDVNPRLVDDAVKHISRDHKISDFQLVNQNGDTITQANFEDKIYVADFFFTTCQTICPIMTDHMSQIQNEIINDTDVMLLSHSVTPKIDSVEQLKRYALKKGVNDAKWNLVTGDKKQIYELARKSYLAVKDDGNGDEFDMIHTENFILIDKKRRIRGFYDGTDIEAISQLLKDLKTLKEEYQD